MILSRLLSPLLRHEPVRVALALVAVIVIFFWNVVFGNTTFLTSDYSFLPTTMSNGPYGYAGHRVTNVPTKDPGASAWQTEPMNRLAAKMWKSGQLPLWNPYVGAGAPLAANMQSGVFYPLNLLTFILPDQAWVLASDWQTLLGFVFAGAFAYLFLRSIGVGELGALGSAIACMFCGNLLFYIGTADWRVDTLLPMLVFSAEKVYSRRNPVWVLLAAAAVFLSVTAGMPESTFFAILLASFYYSFRAISDWARQPRDLRSFLSALLRFAGSVILGAGMAAFLILPFVEYLGVSWNSHSPGVGATYVSPQSAVSILVPRFFGEALAAWDSTNLGIVIPYIGFTVALLASFAVGQGSKLARMAWFWTGVSVFFLLKAFGSPLVQWTSSLPLFSVSIFPRFAAASFAFSAAVLAGIGIDKVRRGELRAARAATTAAVLAILTLALTVGDWPLTIDPSEVIAVPLQIALGGCLLVVVCLVVSRVERQLLNPRLGALALVLMVAGDLFLAAPRDRADKYDPYTPPPFVGFLQTDQAPYRVAGLDYVLYPDSAGVYGVEDITDLDALYPARFTAFIQKFVDPTVYDRFVGQVVYHNKFLDLLNVKYLLTQYPLLDRWTSTEVSSTLAQTNGQPSSMHGVQAVQTESGVVLEAQGPAMANGTARLSFSLRLPQAPVFLRFEFGQPSAAADGVGASPFAIEYTISLRDEKNLVPTLSTRESLGTGTSWNWSGQIIDLSKYSGEDVTLEFAARCFACLPSARGGWRNFELIYPRASYVKTAMSAFLPVDENLQAAQTSLRAAYDGEIRVYENDSAFPRAFVVHSALISISGDDTLEKMSEPNFDPRREVVVEGAASGAGFDSWSAPATDFSAPQITLQEPGRIDLQVSMERPGFLVLTETSYPGWKAKADGKAIPDYVADYAFQSVYLSQGPHQVEFVYEPDSYRIGFIVSLAFLGIAVTSSALWINSRRKWTERVSSGVAQTPNGAGQDETKYPR